MSAKPFDINQVIERIRDQVPELQSVEGTAEYAAITALKDFRPPCAFVLLAQEKADGERPTRLGAPQRALVTFGVVVVVRNYRDTRKGATANDELSPLVGQIRTALKSWEADLPGARSCAWLQGDVADYDSSNLLWIDVFQTQHFIS